MHKLECFCLNGPAVGAVIAVDDLCLGGERVHGQAVPTRPSHHADHGTTDGERGLGPG